MRVVTIQPGFPFIRVSPWAKCDVQQSSDGNRTEHKPTRSGQPDCHVAEAVDAEEDAIGFGDDVGIGVGDRICITTQLRDGKDVALLIYRFHAMGDARALAVVDAEDVTYLNFRSGYCARECESAGIDRG